ncbi:Uncharacterised protein [Bordetella trematum]|nr:Uncharacterised protein [Bordetella trematum]
MKSGDAAWIFEMAAPKSVTSIGKNSTATVWPPASAAYLRTQFDTIWP